MQRALQQELVRHTFLESPAHLMWPERNLF
jgi:hypothetical protein